MRTKNLETTLKTNQWSLYSVPIQYRIENQLSNNTMLKTGFTLIMFTLVIVKSHDYVFLSYTY